MQALEFKVRIDPSADFPDSVNFKTGRASTEAAPSYSTLTAFFGDLIRGYPFPLSLGLHKIDDVSALVAITLFAHRELVVLPNTYGFVAGVELFCSEPIWGPGHIDRDLAHFLSFLHEYISISGNRRQLGDRISTSLTWLRSYLLDGTLPQMPSLQAVPKIVDVGTNGFVIGELERGSCIIGWWDLFRLGHLRGVLLGPSIASGCQNVALARKSKWTQLNLAQAKSIFDILDEATGNSSWILNDNILLSPQFGTTIKTKRIVDVAIHL